MPELTDTSPQSDSKPFQCAYQHGSNCINTKINAGEFVHDNVMSTVQLHGVQDLPFAGTKKMIIPKVDPIGQPETRNIFVWGL